MRKFLLGIAALMSLLWGCNSESDQISNLSNGEFDTNAGVLSRTTSSGLGVDNTILFLQADTTNSAGQLKITANVPEITLTWNVHEESNLDTTLTSIEIVDGCATLNLNWKKKLENGNFAPEAAAFINGIRLSDGVTSLYVHLILTTNPLIEDFEYLLNYPLVETPETYMIQITPEEVAMTEDEGGVAQIMLTGTAPVQVQTERIGSFTKIDHSLLPESIEDDGIVLIPFKWKTTPPDANFKVTYSVYSYDTNLTAEALVSYTKQNEVFLTATPDTLQFFDAGGTQSTIIETNQDKWILQDINNLPEWLSCSAIEGTKGASSLSITTKPNKSVEARSFNLNLLAGTAKQKVRVSQSGFTPEMNVSYSPSTDIKAEGENLIVNIVSNIDWQLSENIPEWLHPNISNGSGNGIITFAVDPLNSFEPRTAVVSVTSKTITPSISRDITLTQKGRNFKVSPPLFPDINAKGDNANVIVTSNVDWEVSEDIPSWIHSNVKKGNGDGNVVLSIDANDTFEKRTASVKIFTMDKSKELSREVLITQNQRSFNVLPTSFPNIKPEGENVNVNVVSNVNWRISEDIPAWILPDVTDGTDNGNINFVIAPNTTNVLRTASVKIYTVLGGVEVSKIVTFTQQNVRLDVSPNSYLNINELGENLTVNVTSNVNWQITGNIPEWLHPDRHSGSGNRSIVFTADANDTFAFRSATVTISFIVGIEVITKEVRFTQKGYKPYLRVSNSSFTNVNRTGAVLSTNISSNTTWTVENGNNWLHVTPSSGSGDTSLRITVSRNNKLAARTGAITLRSTNITGDVVTSTIAIEQKGYGINGNHEGFN